MAALTRLPLSKQRRWLLASSWRPMARSISWFLYTARFRLGSRPLLQVRTDRFPECRLRHN
jgi:hypothetical protein